MIEIRRANVFNERLMTVYFDSGDSVVRILDKYMVFTQFVLDSKTYLIRNKYEIRVTYFENITD